jgi:circadian clock protein KaiC
VVKYRGSFHGTNEYPFLIEREGLSVLPITSVELRHKVSSERVSSGIDRLDTMLGGGYYKGSSILVSGTAGTGKTSFAASFASAVVKSGQKCLYFAFEESEPQIVRNMRSIGIDLDPWVKKGLLFFHALRPSACGLEMHLVKIHAVIRKFQPDAVIIDPISNLTSVGNEREVNSMLNRIIDFVKGKGITSLFTNLSPPEHIEQTEMGISSLMDTWLLLRTVELSGERNRILHILKSRGMAHSNQVREFAITDRGIRLMDVYVGQGQIFTGSAREAQEAKDRAETLERKQQVDLKRREFDRKLKLAETQIGMIRSQIEQDREELRMTLAQDEIREEARKLDRRRQTELRKADAELEHAGRKSRGHDGNGGKR